MEGNQPVKVSSDRDFTDNSKKTVLSLDSMSTAPCWTLLSLLVLHKACGQ